MKIFNVNKRKTKLFFFNKWCISNQTFNIALKSLRKNFLRVGTVAVGMLMAGKNIVQEHTGGHAHHKEEEHEPCDKFPVISTYTHLYLKHCCKNKVNISLISDIR